MQASSSNRFPEIDLNTATSAQRLFVDEITSGPRKAIIGPFIPLLHAPELARRVQKVGEYLRFESTLPADVRECAILVVAHRWKSLFEWRIHAEIAQSVGLPPAVAVAIEADFAIETLETPYREIVAFCRRCLDTGDVGEMNFEDAKTRYGHVGVIELLTICGYYSTLAMYLSSAGIE
jgi:4-carboxymuconolactone decarboxylase